MILGMAKRGGNRGVLAADEVPAIPDASQLTQLQRNAQRSLCELVEKNGGRYGVGGQLPVGHLDAVVPLLDWWARERTVDRRGRLYFSGRPGQYVALQELYPLQDPNRWDRLRAAALAELQGKGWVRARPPRGPGFFLPE